MKPQPSDAERDSALDDTGDREHARLLGQLVMGFVATRMLHAVVRLRIPEELAGGPLAAAELASRTGCDARSLARMMRALAALGVFEERDDDRYALTPAAELLREDHPASVRATVLYFGAPYIQEAWAKLEDGVTTGRTAFVTAHDASYWGYLDRHRDLAATFNEFLAKLRPHHHAAVVEAYDFSCVGEVVDVGGGYGQQLVAILEANPGVRATLFDAPSLEAGASDFLNSRGVLARCRFVAGDFFGAVPEGGDVYILGDVIHDWNDADAVRILTACRRAMSAGSRLLLVEQLISPAAAIVDMHMMVLFGEARQRSEGEFRDILGRAGLELLRVIPTNTECSIVEAAAG